MNAHRLCQRLQSGYLASLILGAFTMLMLLAGCAAAPSGPNKYALDMPDGSQAVVTVIHTKPGHLPKSIPGRPELRPDKSIRIHWPDATWTVCLGPDAGPEYLDWEMRQIQLGTTWDIYDQKL
jgi:hypothetical protein